MEQKKFIQIAVILVAAVWAFCGTMMLSATIIEKQKADDTTTLLTQPPLSTIPSTTIPSTTAPVTVPQTALPSAAVPSTAVPITLGGNNVITTVTVGDPQWLIDQQASIEASKRAEEQEKLIPQGKENIVKAYVDGVNKLKNAKNVTVTKSATLNAQIDNITGGELVENFVNDMIQKNQPADITYTFINGVDQPTGQTPVTAIAPLGVYAALSDSAVTSAKAEGTMNGGYKLTLTLIDETQTYTAPATNHSTTVEVIDVKALIPSGATVNSLDIIYSGTIIEASFDKDNKITSIRHHLPVSKGTGSGSMSALITNINFEMEMHGEYNCTYTVTWQE